MNRRLPVLLLALAAPAAWSGTGQIESFNSSATTVYAGGSIDFSAFYVVHTSFGTQSGGDPEPEPAEGTQFWNVGWSITESELMDTLFLSAGGKSLFLQPASFPGATVAGVWDFSLSFANPGTYYIEANGGWTSNTQYDTYTETASRDCAYSEFGDLQCSPWQSTVEETSDDFPTGGGFEPRGIEITVLAVPEPATTALWALGAGWLAFRRRRAGR